MDPSQLTEEQKRELQEKLKNMSPKELMEFQKKQCIFCQIISGKIPSKKIYEDDTLMAVLDVNPATKGHIILFPKEHYTIMPQIPDDVIGKLFVQAKKLSQTLLKALKVDGTTSFIANGFAAGQRAQHFLLHIIPRKSADGILEIDETLQDHEELLKKKLIIEEKLNSLLGIEKQEELTEYAPKEEVREAEEKEDPEGQQESDEEAQDQEEDNEGDEEQDDEQDDEESDDEESEDESEQKDEVDVSLDDIADLFK